MYVMHQLMESWAGSERSSGWVSAQASSTERNHRSPASVLLVRACEGISVFRPKLFFYLQLILFNPQTTASSANHRDSHFPLIDPHIAKSILHSSEVSVRVCGPIRVRAAGLLCAEVNIIDITLLWRGKTLDPWQMSFIWGETLDIFCHHGESWRLFFCRGDDLVSSEETRVTVKDQLIKVIWLDFGHRIGSNLENGLFKRIQIRSQNPILVLIWIKSSVCVVQNVLVMARFHRAVRYGAVRFGTVRYGTQLSESEWALLPGMFTHTRNLFWWQKLQCNRMTATEQKTQIIKIIIYKIYNVQNSTNNLLHRWLKIFSLVDLKF